MALRDQPYFPLYVDDYLTDEKLNMCKPSSQGIYIKILCIMHKSEHYGCILLKQKDKQTENICLNFASKLARLLPFTVDEINDAIIDLIDEKVLYLDDDMLCQKRMIKDNSISISRSKAGAKGGETTQKKNKEFAKAKPKANSVIVNEDVNEDTSVIIINDGVEFSEFWELYDKKVGRTDAEKKWKKLKESDKQAILVHVPKYVNATPDKQFRKNPTTYLNQMTWLDEELPSQRNQRGEPIKPETPEEKEAREFMENLNAYNTHKTLYGEESANAKFNFKFDDNLKLE